MENKKNDESHQNDSENKKHNEHKENNEHNEHKENNEHNEHKENKQHNEHKVHKEHHKINTRTDDKKRLKSDNYITLKKKIKKRLNQAHRERVILGSLSIILLILLIGVLFIVPITEACTDIDCYIEELNSFKAGVSSEKAISEIDNAISALVVAKEAYQEESDELVKQEKSGEPIKQETPTEEIELLDKIDSDAKFDIFVLNDERCEDCEMMMAQVLMGLNELFPEANYESYDYSENKGKELIDELGIVYLPAVIFDENIELSENYAQIQQFLENTENPDYRFLRIGADHDPTREICDSGVDDTGNGLVDCEDPDCFDSLHCNPDLFKDCAEEFGIEDDIIFYYSDTCPWCTMMKPRIEQLINEGYNVYNADSQNMEVNQLISQCFSDHMSGGVPQFICLNNNEIKVGAFADQAQQVDLDGMRDWFDWCIE